jgi:hypothetical protein
VRTNANLVRSAALVAAIAAAGCSHDVTAPVATIVPVPALTAQNSIIGMPAGWVGTLGQPPSFIVGVESANAHGGTHAAFITNAVAVESGSSFMNIAQLLRADSYVGHRVRWSGWIRSTEVELPYAIAPTPGPLQVSGLWMRVDGRDSSLAFDNMQYDPVVGTTDWHQISIVLDVPANAVGIIFGVIFSGTGQLLVDDLALETVDTSVPATNLQSDPASFPGVGAHYQNVPTAPTNLNFETASQASASLRQPTFPIALFSPIGASSRRRTQ